MCKPNLTVLTVLGSHSSKSPIDFSPLGYVQLQAKFQESH